MINTSCGLGVQNLSPPQAAPHVWTVGCVQALASLLEANVVPVSCAISGVAVLQASCLALFNHIKSLEVAKMRFPSFHKGFFSFSDEPTWQHILKCLC